MQIQRSCNLYYLIKIIKFTNLKDTFNKFKNDFKIEEQKQMIDLCKKKKSLTE